MRTTRSTASRQAASTATPGEKSKIDFLPPATQASGPDMQHEHERATRKKSAPSDTSTKQSAPIVIPRSNQTGQHGGIQASSTDKGAETVEPMTATSSKSSIGTKRKRESGGRAPAKTKRVKFANDPPPSPKANDPNYVVVSSEKDVKAFYFLATAPDTRLADIHTLEIHLNQKEHSEWYDDYLAIALNAFHPRPDGTNPHNLSLIKLITRGGTVFTQFNYTLISPAASGDVKTYINKRMLAGNGGLTADERASLAFKVNSTEKAFSKAILGIRAVKQIVIERKSTGRLEPAFAETIQRTLILPPAAQTVQVQGPGPAPLNHAGVLLSEKLRDKSVKHPYPTQAYVQKPESERGAEKALVDASKMLKGWLAKEDEEATKVKAVEVAKKAEKITPTREDAKKIKASTEKLGHVVGIAPWELRSKKRKLEDDSTTNSKKQKTEPPTTRRSKRNAAPKEKRKLEDDSTTNSKKQKADPPTTRRSKRNAAPKEKCEKSEKGGMHDMTRIKMTQDSSAGKV